MQTLKKLLMRGTYISLVNRRMLSVYGGHRRCFSTNQQSQSEYNTSTAFSRMPVTLQVEVVKCLKILEIPITEAETSINIKRIKESYLRLA